MKKSLICLTVFSALLVACTTALIGEPKNAKSHEPKWGYTGATSPEHWWELSDDYKISHDGKEQSPINITGAHDVDLSPLHLTSVNSKATVEDNGHTIEVKLEDSDNTLTIEKDTYRLEQFHFHAPGENQIDGHGYPLEGHFVYKTEDGKITVVSVLYHYGKENKDLKQIWDNMPQKVGEERDLSTSIAIGDLFPKNLDYYNFKGSLTTPPCTEGVNWVVFKHQENISKQQVEKFSKILGFDNNRPVQALNGREIKE